MDRLGDDIRGELERLGPAGAIGDVAAAWAKSVGPAIAANTSPARIARDGTLYVNASSSTWAFELGQLAPAILGRLAKALGDRAPKVIRFIPGHIAEPDPADAAPAATLGPRPGPEELRKAAELTAEMPEGDLREAVTKAAALSLASAAADRSFW